MVVTMTPLSLLLLLSLSSSPSLLTSAAASGQRSSPYPALLDNYLDATDYDDDSPSPSPTSSSSSPVKSPALTPASPSATSPAPKASAPAVSIPKLSPATSPSPFGSDDKHGSSGTDTVAAGVSSILDPSLKPICATVPFPAVCEANVKAAAPESLKSVDVRSAFHLMMEAYTDEIREIRDKSRALVTSDLYSDPLNMCNRSLGGMLRTSKEMVTAFESDDGGTLKSGMDSLLSSLLSCKEKPTVIQKDMERLYNIWDNIEAIFEKLYPELDPSEMFPR